MRRFVLPTETLRFAPPQHFDLRIIRLIILNHFYEILFIVFIVKTFSQNISLFLTRYSFYP